MIKHPIQTTFLRPNTHLAPEVEFSDRSAEIMETIGMRALIPAGEGLEAELAKWYWGFPNEHDTHQPA